MSVNCRDESNLPRSSGLALTASLYADQLSSNLFILSAGVQQVATRVLVQSALQRYNQGNNTDANWIRARSDLVQAFSGTAFLLQGRVTSKNGTGLMGPYGLINATGQDIAGDVALPYLNSSGQTSYLGDNDTGYPPYLYPNLTFRSTVLNDTFNTSDAFWEGRQLNPNSSILLGPFLLNDTFGLLSITVPIINNTSPDDTLGWLTVVANARAILQMDRSTQGLGNSGQLLIVAPDTPDQRLPATIQGARVRTLRQDDILSLNVKFIFPPTSNASRSDRHGLRATSASNNPFRIRDFPAVSRAFTGTGASDAGSLMTTHNEERKRVSVGYSKASSVLVDWAVLVEQAHGEVFAPINHLRNVLLACVFGTAGGMLLLLMPLAHISVLPIRRLRDATRQSVEPERFPEDDESFDSFTSSGESRGDGIAVRDAQHDDEKRPGMFERMGSWRKWREAGHDRARKQKASPTFRIPSKVADRKHFVHDELTDLTRTFNTMSEELTMQYARLEERVRDRTKELEISKKAAEVANESKTLFIANISHELKTPLNGILGMCAVAMQEEDPSKIRRSLSIIYKSGDLLLHLLTDLLTFTKNQMGQQLTLDEREFRLADVTTQVSSIFEKQAKEGKIDLSLSYLGPSDIDPTSETALPGYGPFGTGRVRDMYLWGDQHRILQVIINLVSNSLKFTPPAGSVAVRIKCLGEVPEKPDSRRGSLNSKNSKNSKRQISSRSSKKAGSKQAPSSSSSISASRRGREGSRYSDTALHINANEPRPAAHGHHRERSTSPIPRDARWLLFEFEVEDTGPGIPESQQQKVFEPFMQGDLGLSKKYAGTGLGLSICSQLATLMRGSIHLDSQVGRGSIFTVRIPLAFTKERADSTTSSRANSRPNSLVLDPGETGHDSRRRSSSSLSAQSNASMPPAINSFDSSAKPRLVGLSQPYFASTSPTEEAEKRLSAMERVAAQAAQSGAKVRVLVAEDNAVNQEVVMRMLKLEQIYGESSLGARSTRSGLRVCRHYHSEGWTGGFRTCEKEYGAEGAL